MKKRNKSKFRALVEKNVSDEVLSVDFVYQCSKRARRYILAYRSIAVANKQADSDKETEKIDIPLIGKLVKRHKLHQSTCDFDTAFIKKSVVQYEKA